ncbi:hypothetical protein HY623_04505 [Candidatus Uhrbacteria bacterium]|nr:hypothetical protein [Candidatus Uhrbacteria bacterium]
MPKGVDESFLAQVAPAVDTDEEQQAQERGGGEQHGALVRAIFAQRLGQNKREEQKLTKELEHWKEELAAQERKKGTCMILLIVAMGDDVIDVLGALVSFGLLSSVTFPIPGIIRMMVAIHEREPRPDRLLRTVAAMAIEAIPLLNLLPTTTINLIIDLIEASWDGDQAKNKVEDLEKKIKTLKQTTGAQTRNAMQIMRGMSQSAMSRRAA